MSSNGLCALARLFTAHLNTTLSALSLPADLDDAATDAFRLALATNRNLTDLEGQHSVSTVRETNQLIPQGVCRPGVEGVEALLEENRSIVKDRRLRVCGSWLGLGFAEMLSAWTVLPRCCACTGAQAFQPQCLLAGCLTTYRR